jgi:hypothetical protein
LTLQDLTSIEPKLSEFERLVGVSTGAKRAAAALA